MACVVFLDGGDDEITEPDFFGFASELGLWGTGAIDDRRMYSLSKQTLRSTNTMISTSLKDYGDDVPDI